MDRVPDSRINSYVNRHTQHTQTRLCIYCIVLYIVQNYEYYVHIVILIEKALIRWWFIFMTNLSMSIYKYLYLFSMVPFFSRSRKSNITRAQTQNTIHVFHAQHNFTSTANMLWETMLAFVLFYYRHSMLFYYKWMSLAIFHLHVNYMYSIPHE